MEDIPHMVDELQSFCDKNNIFIIEDSAQSLGILLSRWHAYRIKG